VARTLLSASSVKLSEVIITVTAGVPGEESDRSVTQRGSRAGFPRSLRLLRHADFERVYKLGRRHFSASFTVFYWPRQKASAGSAKSRTAEGLRIGFAVGRALGGAVQRNRIKRRLREAVRLSRPPVEVAADVVINPKKSLLTAGFKAVLNEVSRAFVVMEEKLEAKPDKPLLAPEDRGPGRRKLQA
jgi:ribonuclease P protein component